MRRGRDEGVIEKIELRVNESIVKSFVEDLEVRKVVNNDLVV